MTFLHGCTWNIGHILLPAGFIQLQALSDFWTDRCEIALRTPLSKSDGRKEKASFPYVWEHVKWAAFCCDRYVHNRHNHPSQQFLWVKSQGFRSHRMPRPTARHGSGKSPGQPQRWEVHEETMGRSSGHDHDITPQELALDIWSEVCFLYLHWNLSACQLLGSLARNQITTELQCRIQFAGTHWRTRLVGLVLQ